MRPFAWIPSILSLFFIGEVFEDDLFLPPSQSLAGEYLVIAIVGENIVFFTYYMIILYLILHFYYSYKTSSPKVASVRSYLFPFAMTFPLHLLRV